MGEALAIIRSIISGLIVLGLIGIVALAIGTIRAIYFDDRDWEVRIRPREIVNRVFRRGGRLREGKSCL